MVKYKEEDSSSLIAKNPSAGRDYTLLDRFEAGIQLQGSEVKSLRARHASLRGSFARVERGQVFLYGLDISPYPQAGPFAPEPKRTRKLLLHKAQIKKLDAELIGGGVTLVPTRLYFKGSLVKIELALAKGKKHWDKRESIKKREHEREMSRALKHKDR